MEEYLIEDLVCVAKRENNSKRAYLYVNPIQGKHVPVNPEKPLRLYKKMARMLEESFSGERLLVIGFAETATAIGAAISYYASNVLYCTQTTREKYYETSYLYFSESHSHASEQSLIIDKYCNVLDKVDRIVFAEDEVTTGKTISKLIDELECNFSSLHLKFGIISILNSMSSERIEQFKSRGVKCLWVTKMPYEYNIDLINDYIYKDFSEIKEPNHNYKTIGIKCPENLRYIQDKKQYADSVNLYISRIFQEKHIFNSECKILVLGTEEYMFPAMLFAETLQRNNRDCEVMFHATTRSPIMISESSDYPLHNRFSLHSVYEDERKTYIYNLSDYDVVYILTDCYMGDCKGYKDLASALKSVGCKKVYVLHDTYSMDCVYDNKIFTSNSIYNESVLVESIEEKYIRIGYGCDERKHNFCWWESDMFCVLLNGEQKCIDNSDLVFYNNLSNNSNTVRMIGDCISGCAGCTHCGEVDLNLANIPKYVEKILCFICISRRDEQFISFDDFDKEFMYIRRLDRWDSCHGPVINGGIINWQGDKNKNVGKLCEIIRKENGWEIIVSGQMLNGDILGTVSKYINLSD